MPLPIALQGDTWTKKTGRHILPLLAWCAQHGRTITYGHLDRELVRRRLGHHVHAAQYGHPAGAVGDALMETAAEIEHDVPPLNALVINKSTGLPGHGCDYYLDLYVRGGRRRTLTQQDRQALSEQVQEEVFQYPDWDKILKRYGMQPLTDEIPPEDPEDDEEYAPPTGGWSSEGESEAHRTLKEYVLENPYLVLGDRNGWAGTTEYSLPSGDWVDVFFEGNGRRVAIEVKSVISNDNDLSRGIFQCVKYRAVLRAWQKTQQEIPNGTSILVTQRILPPDLKHVARLLGVQVVVIPEVR